MERKDAVSIYVFYSTERDVYRVSFWQDKVSVSIEINQVALDKLKTQIGCAESRLPEYMCQR